MMRNIAKKISSALGARIFRAMNMAPAAAKSPITA
jgi:hypothetical protein